jgi:amidase
MSTVPEPFAGIHRQADWLASGRATSVDLTEDALQKADRAQASINAFRVLHPERAIEDAAAADRRLAAGEQGPLLGIPIAIKDDCDVAGETTPFGCPGPFPIKTEDGEAVRRLRQAGAVIIGKTNTPEFGQWPWTEGSAFGATRNPWSLDFSPGGSSGGSAAAVAAGVVAAGLGSDGAGSVRIPAAWTGLVGIKPQRGRISTWPDPESFNGITCFGPLARTVADAALLLDAAAGNHAGDRHQPPRPATSYAESAARPPGRLRVALAWRIPFSIVHTALDPQVETAVRAVAEGLARLGHRVEEASPRYGLIGASFVPRSTAGLADWCLRVPEPSLLDPRTLRNADMGRRMRGRLLRLGRALERPFAAQLGRIFRHFDVVLAPTTAQPPIPVGASDGLTGWQTDKLMVSACPYAWPWNVVGWPAVNVPAGLTGAGLPLGAQLMGPANSEGLLISLAAELEGASGWADRHPPAPPAPPAIGGQPATGQPARARPS